MRQLLPSRRGRSGRCNRSTSGWPRGRLGVGGERRAGRSARQASPPFTGEPGPTRTGPAPWRLIPELFKQGARRVAFAAAMEAPLTLDQLRNAVQAGRIDTVLLALTDMQGRLQGKRLTAHHFLDDVLEHGA